MTVTRDMAPYIPGLTARPASDAFAAIRDTVTPDMTVNDIAASEAWRAGWELLEQGCFWEAHEVWEPVWLSLPPNSVERHFVQACIQFANACLKHRMQRPQAAARLVKLAREHLKSCRDRGVILGIDSSELDQRLDRIRPDFRDVQNNA